MAIDRLRQKLMPWLEERMGASPTELSAPNVPVVALEARIDSPPPVFGVALGSRGVITTRPDWEHAVHRALGGLTYDLLFSIYGAYEISRATLRHGFTGWGPYFCLAADKENFRTIQDERPVYMSGDEIRSSADPKIFWHCFVDEAIGGFGIFDDGKLVSLASVRTESDELLEIGVDSAQEAQGRGMGRAVASAAGSWILDQDKLVWWTTSTWNVPSSRLSRALGLAHVWSEIVAVPGPFRMPPQPLGAPAPDAEIRQYYPEWAMNQNIKPRED
jgi:RimJ/RimL family protein N-acetyltransferase